MWVKSIRWDALVAEFLAAFFLRLLRRFTVCRDMGVFVSTTVFFAGLSTLGWPGFLSVALVSLLRLERVDWEGI